jgi:hypothetical protein
MESMSLGQIRDSWALEKLELIASAEAEVTFAKYAIFFCELQATNDKTTNVHKNERKIFMYV